MPRRSAASLSLLALLSGCALPPPGGSIYVPPPPAPLVLTPISRPIAPAPAYSAQGIQAIWTGRQQYTQTISYQAGVNCEYMANGRSFWRTFVGAACPPSITVQ